MLPRCPDCGRPVALEEIRLRGRLIPRWLHPGWLWCLPCGRRVEVQR